MGHLIADRVGPSNQCPCGSGRKYKNCCMNADRMAYAMARDAVSKTVDDLAEYASTGYKGALDDILDLVATNASERYSEEEVGDALENNRSFLAPCMLDIAIADFELKRGERILDRYLNERGLPRNQLANCFVQSWRERGLSLYEVVSVVPRKSFSVVDAFNMHELKVSDSMLSDVLQEGEAFFGRIARVGELSLITLSFLPADPCDLDFFPDECRRLRESTPGSRSLSWDRFFSKHWDIIPSYWLNGVIREGRGPLAVNTDGDPVEPIRVRCRLRPGTGVTVAERLLSVNGVSEEYENHFLLHCKPSDRNISPLDNVLVASFHLDGDQISADVNSAARADRVEALLKELLGNRVLETTRESIEFDELTGPGEHSGEDVIPEDEKNEVIRCFLDQHYRKWLDLPIPALNNISPRMASRDRKMRRRLLRLLVRMEGIPSSVQSGYDTSWIWRELGLAKP